MLLGIERPEHGGDQQFEGAELPVAALAQRAFGIDQHVGQDLRVANFGIAAADLGQRIVAMRAGFGRRKAIDRAEGGPQAGRDRPVLALEIEREIGMPPDEAGRQRDADALAGVGGRDDEHVLIAIMAEELLVPGAEDDAIAAGEVEPA